MDTMQYYGVAFSSDDAEALDLGPALTAPKDWSGYPIKRGVDISQLHLTLPTLFMMYGGFADYQASNLGDVCSKKLKDVIEQNKAVNDHLQWCEVLIKNTNYGNQTYYLLHFPVLFDVLDIERTDFIGSIDTPPYKAHLQLSLLKGHHIFAYPNAYSGFMVSAFMKERLQESGCTGLNFYPIEAS